MVQTASAGAAAHRVDPGPHGRGPRPAPRPSTSSARTSEPDRHRQRQPGQAARAASPYDAGLVGEQQRRPPRRPAPRATGSQDSEHRDRAVRRRPGAAGDRPRRPRPAGALLDALGRRPRPVLALGHRRRTPPSPGATSASLPTSAPGQQHAARADPGPGADPDRAEVHDVAVDPVAAEVDLRLDRAARAERGACPVTGGSAVQVDVAADLGAEQPGVPGHVRRAGQPGGAELVDHAAGPARAAGAPCRRAGGRPALDAAQQQPRAGGGEQHPAGRRQEHQPAEQRAATSRPAAARVQPSSSASERRSRCRPRPASAGPASARSSHGGDHLADLGLERRRRDGPVRGRARRRPSRRGRRPACRPSGARRGRRPRPRGSARAAGRPSGPRSGCRRRGRRSRRPASATSAPSTSSQSSAIQAIVPVSSGELRPRRLAGSGQGSASRSTLPDVRVGRPSTTASRGTRAAGSAWRSSSMAWAWSKPSVDGDVADQQLVAGAGPADRRRGADDAGEPEQRAVDLAELDAPAAELDLVVGAAAEEQARGVVHDQVAAAVGAVPAQRGHRRRTSRRPWPGRGSGPGPTPPMISSPVSPSGDGLPGGVDDGEVPAVERQADPDRPLAGQLGAAGHDRRLGRAVGVPDLAAGRHQPGGELGRARPRRP